MRIMREITSIRPFVERGPIIGSAIVRLDEPELFGYPIAYLSEPGGWTMSDAELRGLRHTSSAAASSSSTTSRAIRIPTTAI